jgi:hypothetical protein
VSSAVVTLLLGAPTSCRQIVGIDDRAVHTCDPLDAATDDACLASCTPSAPTPGGPWACVGNVHWFNSDPTPMTLTGAFRDAISGQPLPGLSVRACSAADPPCAQPLVTTVAGADGALTLTFDSLAKSKFFDGYLEISGVARGAHYDVLYYFFPPPTTDSDIGRDLASIESMKVLASAAGIVVDDARGHALFTFRDCRFDPASDVSIAASTADAETIRYFMVNGSPTTTAPSSASGSGGGFLDVPPGLATFTASYTPQCLQYMSRALFIRAGWITEAELLPSP